MTGRLSRWPQGRRNPLLARIIAVPDTFDALIQTGVPEGKPDHEALTIVESLAGTQLDPSMVRVLAEIIGELEGVSEKERIRDDRTQDHNHELRRPLVLTLGESITYLNCAEYEARMQNVIEEIKSTVISTAKGSVSWTAWHSKCSCECRKRSRVGAPDEDRRFECGMSGYSRCHPVDKPLSHLQRNAGGDQGNVMIGYRIPVRKKLGEILVTQGRLTPVQMADLLRLQKTSAKPFGQVCLNTRFSQGRAEPDPGRTARNPHVWLRKGLVDPRIVHLLPKETAIQYQAIPCSA